MTPEFTDHALAERNAAAAYHEGRANKRMPKVEDINPCQIKPSRDRSGSVVPLELDSLQCIFLRHADQEALADQILTENEKQVELKKHLSESVLNHCVTQPDTSTVEQAKALHNRNYIDSWTTVRRIGAGGFGEVWLCVDNKQQTEFASKIVHIGPQAHELQGQLASLSALSNTYASSICNNDERTTQSSGAETLGTLQRIAIEITLMQSLRHRNIIHCFGICFKDEEVHIQMEYMEHGSVGSMLKAGPLNLATIQRITSDVLRGLDYLHCHHIIHRDVKCANILMDMQGSAKLGDFGASTMIQSVSKPSTLNAKTSIGTPYWMSPEMVLGAGYGRRTDVWSLGCTVIEMMTGKPPWYKLEPMAALFHIGMSKEIPQFPNDIEGDWNNALRQMLVRDPAGRITVEQLQELPLFQ
eukprot:Clim_evm23s159 gene=Clim_evmTU23s159